MRDPLYPRPPHKPRTAADLEKFNAMMAERASIEAASAQLTRTIDTLRAQIEHNRGRVDRLGSDIHDLMFA